MRGGYPLMVQVSSTLDALAYFVAPLLLEGHPGPFVLLLSIFMVLYVVVYMYFKKSTLVELRRIR
jgi:hypothetical protein